MNAQQFLLRPDHLIAHHCCPVGRLEHGVQVVLILLPQIQGTADAGKNLGGHVELFPKAEARHRLKVFQALIDLPDAFARAMHQGFGDIRVDIR